MNRLALLRLWAEQQEFAALRDACLAGSGSAEEQVLLALALAHLGEGDAAQATLAVLDGAALELAARVDRAAVHLALHELDAAAALLEAALPEAGHDGLLLARLAWCRMQQGRPDEALALYQRSAAAKPRLPVLLNLLRLQLLAGASVPAQHSLDQAGALWAAQQVHAAPQHRQQVQLQLHGLQLDIWLASEQHAAAEAWLADQRTQLAEADWCTLVLGCSQRLSASDRHAEAEDLLRDALRHCPGHLALYVQSAELALVLGRVQQAAALLRRAISGAEAQGQATLQLWVRLSAVCLQHDDRAACDAAEKALQQPADAQGLVQAELAMAAVQTQQQQPAQAEARYAAVLALQPTLVPALHGLGQLLMQQGRIDEAVARFEQVREHEPEKGLAALISARRFPHDADALDRLEQAARTPDMEGRVRTSLLFQLAAAWEQRQDFERAFTLADEANAASRRHLRYDPVAHRQRCARIRHAFTRELYQQRSGGLPSTVPVFVLGMPRSGTTLVEQILAGHSQIHGAGELGLVPQVIATLERWERRTGSGRHYPDCVDDLSPPVLAGLAGQVLQELQAYAPDARHVIDKLPHNFENIGLIKLLFPNAKIISVRRDPRDIALSNYFTDYGAKHGGMGFAYDLEWIGEQLADHNLLMQGWQQLFPGEILEVRYEDVVADTEAAARRMLVYLGVEWEARVLNFNTLQRPVKTASVWQVRQPIYTSSTAKWQHHASRLAPLIRGTNRKIGWQPITDMLTLPEPGLLDSGVALYRAEQLDAAEGRFKQLLHHVPGHAAATFMVGLIDVRKGWLHEGIAQMEQALQRCPWNVNWQNDLAQARAQAGLPGLDAPDPLASEEAAW